MQRHTITLFSPRVTCVDTVDQDFEVVSVMPSTLAVNGGASTAVGLYLVRSALERIGKGAVEAVQNPTFQEIL